MKHPKRCESQFNLRRSFEIPLLIRCEKQLRHRNREHQARHVRWTDATSIHSHPEKEANRG